MKKIFSLVLSVVIIFSCTSTAFAVPLINSWEENGDTYLGTFKTSELVVKEEKDFLKKFIASDNNLLYTSWDSINNCTNYYFVICTDPKDVKVTWFEPDSSMLQITGFVYTMQWKYSAKDKTMSFYGLTGSSTGIPSVVNPVIISGTVFSKGYNFPGLSDKYLADFIGTLYLVDDSGVFTPPPAPDVGFLDKIFGWLSEFWQKLKDFFIGIFVPSPDYFQKFYDDILKSAKSKLGGISSLYDILHSFFTTLGSSATDITPTFIWDIPFGAMYQGSPAHHVDIFKYALPYIALIKGIVTASIVISTGISCYRHIVGIFEN